ncbi:MAG: winged helix-turn-helix transcriptional regulator [Anaerolineales bacterium]|jgi:DNA-binding MarR family transcriptional regulator
MENSTEVNRELALLESIELDPDITQANLASQLGVAVGTINWHIKRLIEKGYVKIKRAERKKLRYIITPEGIAMRAHLTVDFIEQQFNLYRNTRQKVKDQLKQVKKSGYSTISLVGDGDVADVCKLTCIEQGIEITNDENNPVLEVIGLKVVLHMEADHGK